jgi:hypothetical protein
MLRRYDASQRLESGDYGWCGSRFKTEAQSYVKREFAWVCGFGPNCVQICAYWGHVESDFADDARFCDHLYLAFLAAQWTWTSNSLSLLWSSPIFELERLLESHRATSIQARAPINEAPKCYLTATIKGTYVEEVQLCSFSNPLHFNTNFVAMVLLYSSAKSHSLPVKSGGLLEHGRIYLDWARISPARRRPCSRPIYRIA